MRRLPVLLFALLISSLLTPATTARGDPSYGSDAALPIIGVNPRAVLEPVGGRPAVGPGDPPPATVISDLLSAFPPNPFPSPSAEIEVDDISYGDETLIGPLQIEFSTGAWGSGETAGHPDAPLPPSPSVDVTREVALPSGDGSADADVFITSGQPLDGPLSCATIGGNVLLLDEDGAPLAFGNAHRLGLNLPPTGGNLDAYELSDHLAVDFSPAGGDGVPDKAVFFTIDATTAAAWPAGAEYTLEKPDGTFVVPGPSDILAYDPAGNRLRIWATAADLGLLPADDIDALAVSYGSARPISEGFSGSPDAVVFSLAPGSPSLASSSGGSSASALAPACSGPGTATAADAWFVDAPATVTVATPFFDAEMFGLSTVRSGGAQNQDDNLDAMDLCNLVGPAADHDSDGIDDSCDPDDDNDGLLDIDEAPNGCSPLAADADNDGLDDYGEVVVVGTSCTDPDTDDDGFKDLPDNTYTHQNTNTARDNCPLVHNPGQENTDTAPIPTGRGPGPDMTAPNGDNEGDACDTDDDNDGLSDGSEGVFPIPGCAAGVTGPTNGLSIDTDNDGSIDGYECSVSNTDPANAASKPGADPPCTDTDGDRVKSAIEARGWATNPEAVDSDGDGLADGVEIYDVNLDHAVTYADALIIAKAAAPTSPFLPPPLTAAEIHAYDMNRDGAVTFADNQLAAKFIAGEAACQ